ncbi:helix-turn-helix domain-containing protein [Burkholderia cepacia]|uniref:helix-turn-helix domain-containing protein n=1 Tax=Burkholderia cepacia TaxID=292 RepID=UPI00158BB376|nr:helix-turn-helix domain-containing protein [Burkholderia cepacia]
MLTITEPYGGSTSLYYRESFARQTDQGRQASNIACKTCAMAGLCTRSSIDNLTHERLNAAVHCVRTVHRGHALYRPGDTFASIYAIRAGSFKTVVMHQEGHEQVTGFGIVGDTLGIDGIATGRHSCEAIALEDSSVCAMPFDLLEMLCREVKAVQRHVHQMLGAEIVRESVLMMLLGTTTAEERVATFLVDLSKRWQTRGYSAAAFTLKMTREEVGSYLGLKLETVSRMLSKLQGRGLIEVRGKDLRILDIDGLQKLATDVGPATFQGQPHREVFGYAPDVRLPEHRLGAH